MRLFCAKFSGRREACSRSMRLEALELPRRLRNFIFPPPAWRNWQTRWTQNPVLARVCGFEHLRRDSLYSAVYEGKLIKYCKQPISHGHARKRTDSPFDCQQLVNGKTAARFFCYPNCRLHRSSVKIPHAECRKADDSPTSHRPRCAL